MSWHGFPEAFAALARDRRGVAAVEFAVVGVFAVTLLVGTIEVARYQIAAQTLRSLAAEAARGALVGVNRSLGAGGCAQASLDRAALLQGAPVLRDARLTLQVSRTCPTATGAGSVTVQASYDFDFVVGFLPRTRLTETASLAI